MMNQDFMASITDCDISSAKFNNESNLNKKKCRFDNKIQRILIKNMKMNVFSL